MTPQISIIVPLYNAERYFEACMDSILRQTYQDFEVIIIDDGSIDRSLEIARQYEVQFPSRIRLFSQMNSGQAVARNFGIDQAVGEYVAFVDGDDVISENMLAVMYQEAVQKNADVVVCDIRVVRTIGDHESIHIEQGLSALANHEDVQKAYLLAMPSPCNKLFKRSLLNDHHLRFLEHCIYEDLGMIPLIGLYARKIAYVSQDYYHYLTRPVSTMNNNRNEKRLDDIFIVMKSLQQAFNDSDHAYPFSHELEFLFIEHLLFGASHRFIALPGYQARARKVHDLMKAAFPGWRKNPYYKRQSVKYRIVCNLFYDRLAWPLQLRQIMRSRQR